MKLLIIKRLVEGGRIRQAGCWPLRNVAGCSTALRAKRWALITLERRCRHNKSPTFAAFKQISVPSEGPLIKMDFHVLPLAFMGRALLFAPNPNSLFHVPAHLNVLVNRITHYNVPTTQTP